MIIDAIILARGGSKGIPNKNIIDLCGKPLISWTIEQCLSSKYISNTWVSSDSDKILEAAIRYGAKTIKRPDNISDDFASSEAAWIHAIKNIEQKYNIDIIVAPQITSPLREARDFDEAIKLFQKNEIDSMFSSNIVDDLLFWERDCYKKLKSINYDYLNRKRRQDIKSQIIENGSFYIFKPESIKKYNNRFGKHIGHFEMESWKMFEIDNFEDLRLCSVLMKEFLLKKGA